MQVVVTLVLATNAVSNARAALIGWLAAATVLLMISGNNFDNLFAVSHGGGFSASAKACAL